jgi:signal transduction histidine kinase
MTQSATIAKAVLQLDELHASVHGDWVVLPEDLTERLEDCVATLSEAGGQRKELGRALVLLALARCERGRAAEGLEHMETAFELLNAHKAEQELLLAELTVAELLLARGDLKGCSQAVESAQHRADALGDVGLAQVTLTNLWGRLASRRGEHQRARAEFQKAQDLCIQLGARGRLVRLMLNLGVAAYSQNDSLLAIEYHEAALAHVLQELDPPRSFVRRLLLNLGLILISDERFERAAEVFRQALEWVTLDENPYVRLRVRLGLGKAAIGLGDLEAARELVEELTSEAPSWMALDSALHIGEDICQLLWALGDVAKMTAIAGQVLAGAAGHLEWSSSLMRVRAWMLRARVASGEDPDVVHRDLLGLLTRFDQLIEREAFELPTLLHQVAVEVCEAAGDYKSALQHIRLYDERFVRRMRRMLHKPESQSDVVGDREGLVGDLLRHLRILEQTRKDLEREASERREQAERRAEAEASVERLRGVEMIGRLAGSIAHDFNNLLTVILGNAELIEETTQDARERNSIEAIRSAGESGAALVRRLLAMGRSTSTESRPVSSVDFLRESLPIMRSVLGVNVAFAVEGADVAATVLADPNQLQAVLLNLVLNARESMPDGGRLLISSRVLSASEAHQSGRLESPDGIWALSVADSGRGIPPDQVELIFEPFYTTRASDVGSGMGLTSARDIARRFGGELRVVETGSHGTTFELCMPLSQASASAVATDQSSSADLSGYRLLLAEDNDEIRNLACRVLEASGAEVFAARDGRDALTVWRALPAHRAVHALVTDLVMPHMGGHELVKKLQAEGARLPVLYISAHATHLETRAEEAFLAKPFRMPDLCESVARLIRATLR